MNTEQQQKHIGVLFEKRRNKWRTQIKIQGETKFLGYFNSFEEAVEARKAAELKFRKPLDDIRNQLEADVIELYNNNHSISQIQKLLPIGYWAVNTILINNNIQIRTEKDLSLSLIKEMYENGKTIQEIAKIIGVAHASIRRRLVKMGFKIRENRKHFFDQGCLRILDEEWKCYFLGLFFADGNVRKELNCCTISLIVNDGDILDFFAEKFDTVCKTYKRKPQFDKATGKTYIGRDVKKLNISGREFAEVLVSYGCVPNKSLILEWPKLENLWQYKHFLRGYLDGDGHISKTGKICSFLGSDNFCLNSQSFLQTLNIHSKLIKRGKITNLLIWRKEDRHRFREFLYSDATLFFPRKRDRCYLA